jgi:hypothetical protein
MPLLNYRLDIRRNVRCLCLVAMGLGDNPCDAMRWIRSSLPSYPVSLNDADSLARPWVHGSLPSKLDDSI